MLLCSTCGIFEYKRGELVTVTYSCPRCKDYKKTPIMVNGKTVICECEIHGRWTVDFIRSFYFRKLCSLSASKPNKDPRYYTPPELRIKKILDMLGLKENVDYFHNRRVRNDRGYFYYPDFMLDGFRKVIECSPRIWHGKYWNISDKERADFFHSIGYDYIRLDDHTEPLWMDIIRNEILGDIDGPTKVPE